MSNNMFTVSIPSRSLQESQEFYSKVLGCKEESRGTNHIQYSLFGHELKVFEMEESFVPQEHCNHVDKYDVPVPHFGIVLSKEQFHQLSQRLANINIKFIIEPHLRFQGLAGEQWTMFFKDPTGNNLEFKAMSNPNYLFQAQWI